MDHEVGLVVPGMGGRGGECNKRRKGRMERSEMGLMLEKINLNQCVHS